MLAGVIDPELHASIVELGMVDDVRSTPTARSS
jgi:metal-sulfur cluster biosynthetic enzyme